MMIALACKLGPTLGMIAVFAHAVCVVVFGCMSALRYYLSVLVLAALLR